MHVAHRKYNLLMSFFVSDQTQGWINFRLLGKECSQLILILLIFSFKGDGVKRNGTWQRINLDIARKRECITGFRLIHLGDHNDIAGFGALNIHRLLAHHHVKMRKTFFLLTTRVRKLHSRLKVSGKHLDKAHAANIRIGERLENESSRFARFVNIELFTISQIEGPMCTRMGKIASNILH